MPWRGADLVLAPSIGLLLAVVAAVGEFDYLRACRCCYRSHLDYSPVQIVVPVSATTTRQKKRAYPLLD